MSVVEKATAGDAYEYVRNYYGVPAYIGVRVRLVRNGKREGVIVQPKRHDQYVHIVLDGERRPDIYHPTDGITYLIGDPKMFAALQELVASIDNSDFDISKCIANPAHVLRIAEARRKALNILDDQMVQP